MTRKLIPDGVQAAADRELDFHPLRVWPDGKERPISAWQRRADTIKLALERVNEHDQRLDVLEELAAEVRSRPF